MGIDAFKWITGVCICTVTAGGAFYLGKQTRSAQSSVYETAAIVVPAPAVPEPPEEDFEETDYSEESVPLVTADEILSIVNRDETGVDPVSRFREENRAAALLANADSAVALEVLVTTTSHYLRESAARRCGELDPQGALKLLNDLPVHLNSSKERERLTRGIFQGWAHVDAPAAIEEGAIRQKASGDRAALNAAVTAAIADDPDRGLALAKEQDNLSLGKQARSRALWDKDPEGFARAVGALPFDSSLLSQLREGVVDAAKAWSLTDPTSFASWAKDTLIRYNTSLPKSYWRANISTKLFPLLLSRDPESAAEVYAATPRTHRRSMTKACISRLASEDPISAAEWIDTNLSTGRASAFEAWAVAATESLGAESTVEMARQLPLGTAREAATSSALLAWSREDLPSAISWAKNQADEHGEASALNTLSFAWLEHSGGEAGRYILQNPELGWSSSAIRAAVLRTPVAEAINLVAALPIASAEPAAEAIGERLADKRIDSTDLAPLPEASQQAAISAATKQLAWSDMAHATAWVEALKNPSLRKVAEKELRDASAGD